MNSLTLEDETLHSADNKSYRVRIKYIRMKKVEYLKLRPIENKFSNIVQIKQALQDNLIRHSTITVGDMLSIWYRGEEYKLRVIEAKPSNFGTLIESDVEV